jgi:hypothetical protein
MPLVKIFARSTLAKPVPLAAIQAKLCDIWGTQPNTTKLILQRVEDWTNESFQEDVYVDIRAYGKTFWWQIQYVLTSFTHSKLTKVLFRSCLACISGKAERTREFVLDGMHKAQVVFQEHDLIANIRLETYEGERYFHVPPTPTK